MSGPIFQTFIVILVLRMSHRMVYGDALASHDPPFDVLNNSFDELRKVEYTLTDDEEKNRPNCSHYVAEKEYVRLENGSLILPGSEHIYDYDSYYLRNGTAYLCSDETLDTEVEPAHNFSDKFLRCGHILIENEEYKLLQNGSIHIAIYSKTYDPMDYFIQDHGVYICVPSYETLVHNQSIPSELHKFSQASDYVTLVGLLISIVSLMSHLIMFCLISSVRNLPGCCLASLSLSLLIAYACFLTAFLLERDEVCAGLGMCVYYFFLTSFFWMNAIAFDVWRSFRVVMRELRISSQRVPWKRFSLYSLYSWAVPALFTVMVKVFDSTDLLPEDFRPAFGNPYCWFGQRKALLIFFAVPLIAVMLLNVAFFADVIYVINLATLKTGHSHDATLKKRFVMFTRLALIMGLTWVFGIAAGFADNAVLWYIFIVLNTLQGLFIFAVFLASSKVRTLCIKKCQHHSAKRFSTSVRTISAAL